MDIARSEHEVNVVGHQDIGPELTAIFVFRPGEPHEEGSAIRIVEEDGFAVIAANHHVVERAGKPNARGTWHSAPRTVRGGEGLLLYQIGAIRATASGVRHQSGDWPGAVRGLGGPRGGRGGGGG